MLLARGDAVEGLCELLAGDAGGFNGRHAFKHGGERGAASYRRGTSVGQKTRGLYPAIAQAQGETQAVAADGVGLFRDSVGVGKFSGVARVG
ncbi:MAG: hypothetical protein QOD00_114 [Blastocatellia bacterium]|nr:hypothetical protein [Blastocatellia bacterium]